jgi:hypothetical protein
MAWLVRTKPLQNRRLLRYLTGMADNRRASLKGWIQDDIPEKRATHVSGTDRVILAIPAGFEPATPRLGIF